jgi:uncharacterized repeat protein (TIGR02543 family)
MQNFTLNFILSNQTENEITDIESGSSINIADKVKLDGYNVKFYEDANYSKQITDTEIVINSDVIIYVKLEAITYFIEYELNDGRWNNYSANTSYTVETANIPGADCILRDGYTFEGWYKDANYTEKITSLVGLFEDITLYANWEVINYSIKYELNDGTWADGFISENSYTIESAADFGLPTSEYLTKQGFVFDGWYDNSEYTYAIDSLVGRTGDLTLYAKWRDVNQVATVKFSPAADGVDMGTLITLSCATEGATIYYTIDGSDPQTSENRTTYSEDAPICIKAATTIKAYATKANAGMKDSDVSTITYKLNVYTLNFDANGGTLPSDMQSSEQVTSGDVYYFSNIVPTKTGYDFKGWYLSTNPDATENPIEVYAPNIENTLNKTVTFYAKWEPIKYTVIFDSNGGSGTVTVPPQTFTYDVAQELTENPFTRTGYTFKGWNTVQNPTRENLGVSYNDKQSVKNLTTSGRITLYAQWEANKATITVTMPTYSDIQGELKEPTKNDDGELIFTVPEGVTYTHNIWYVNGKEKQQNTGSTNEWTFDTSSVPGGIYTIMLVVEDSNGNKYSAEYQVTVTK